MIIIIYVSKETRNKTLALVSTKDSVQEIINKSLLSLAHYIADSGSYMSKVGMKLSLITYIYLVRIFSA